MHLPIITITWDPVTSLLCIIQKPLLSLVEITLDTGFPFNIQVFYHFTYLKRNDNSPWLHFVHADSPSGLYIDLNFSAHFQFSSASAFCRLASTEGQTGKLEKKKKNLSLRIQFDLAELEVLIQQAI